MTTTSLAEYTARSLASRVDRRGFLGRLGMGLIAVGAGDLAIQSRRVSALAASARANANADTTDLACCGCPVCDGHSGTCTTNPLCPSDACDCGSWYMCSCLNNTKLEQFRDCCAACTGGCFCGGEGRPKCNYPAQWIVQGCNGHTTVKCRTNSCTNMLC